MSESENEISLYNRKRNQGTREKDRVNGGINHPKLLQPCETFSKEEKLCNSLPISLQGSDIDLGFETSFCNISSS